MDTEKNKDSFLKIIDEWSVYESASESVSTKVLQTKTHKFKVSSTNDFSNKEEFKLSIYLIRIHNELEFSFVDYKGSYWKGTIKISENLETLFVNLFKEITDIDTSSKMFAHKLNLIGMKLYDSIFPDVLKKLYWQIREKINSIQIISEELWIPWELIKPWEKQEDGNSYEDQFLGERYSISQMFVTSKITHII